MNLNNKKIWGAIALLALVSSSIVFFRTRTLPGYGLTQAIIPAISIVAGYSNSLVVMEDGSLWSLSVTQCTTEGISLTEEPEKIMDDVSAVFSEGPTTMIITTDGTLWSQGIDIQGQRHWLTRFMWMITPLSTPRNYNPSAIMNNVVTIAMNTVNNSSYAMAITSDGGLWGWGYNRFGQLGTGTTENRRRNPVRVMDDVIDVSVGGNRTFAVTSDRTLWGWGDNRFGWLGDGTTERRRTPVRIMDDVVYITSNRTRNFAITSDGGLWGCAY